MASTRSPLPAVQRAAAGAAGRMGSQTAVVRRGWLMLLVYMGSQKSVVHKGSQTAVVRRGWQKRAAVRTDLQMLAVHMHCLHSQVVARGTMPVQEPSESWHRKQNCEADRMHGKVRRRKRS